MTERRTPCPQCDDTGWQPIVDARGIDRLTRCQCWIAAAGARGLADARVPRKYHRCTLDNFHAYHALLQRAQQKVQQYVDSFPNVAPYAGAKRGLCLHGLPGTGKSHLAAAALQEIVRRTQATARFVDTRDLLRLIRHSYNPTTQTTEEAILRPVLSCDLLVLDDLGAEKLSEWVEETMNLIVNTRYCEERRTIVTTNYPDGELDDPLALQCRIGFRMRSRLAEMCEFVELDGADFRTRPPNASDRDLRQAMLDRGRSLPRVGGRAARVPTGRDGAADLKYPGGRAGNHE